MSVKASDPATTQAPPGTQAIVRAVRLLKTVASAGDTSSLAHLSEALDLSKPTVHRILAALESEGLVARDGGAIRLGSAVITLGAQALAGNNLRAIARTFLERLASESGETATLEIPAGPYMLILDEVRGRQLVGAHAEVGTQWPMYATSSGKAFLATLSESELSRRLRATRKPLTSSTLITDEDLRDSCRQARERGFAVSEEELEGGYSAVGAVVLGPAGRPVAALSVGGPTDRLIPERLVELGEKVKQVAEKLGRELGA